MLKMMFIFSLLAVFVCAPIPAGSEMAGTHYKMTSAVVSGGGAPSETIGGTGANGTVGQSSPLMDPDAALPGLESANYRLYPGFWQAGSDGCYGDAEPDDDVDGADLAAYILAADFTTLPDFAISFGRLCR